MEILTDKNLVTATHCSERPLLSSETVPHLVSHGGLSSLRSRPSARLPVINEWRVPKMEGMPQGLGGLLWTAEEEAAEGSCW